MDKIVVMGFLDRIFRLGGEVMCTAATYKTKDFYIGRTLDYEFSYGEEVVVNTEKLSICIPLSGRDEKPLCNDRNCICQQATIHYTMMQSTKRGSAWQDLILLEMQYIRNR